MPTKPVRRSDIVIKSEKDAISYLEAALNQRLGDAPVNIEFKNWPVLTIKLEGKGYDSTITSRLAESLVELQHALNRTYARAAHGTANANTLTAEEKSAIQFKAKVEKGSSIVKVDLGDFAEKVAATLIGKMDSTSIVIAVASLALIAGGVVAYKAFLRHRSEDKKVDLATQERIALSQEETRRMEIMHRAMTAQPHLRTTVQEFDDVRHGIVKSVGDANSIDVQGVTLTKAEARTLATGVRNKAEEVQLNGHYRIVKIDWSRDDQARLSLFSTDQSLEFTASLNTSSLDAKHKDMLKAAEWDRKVLYLSINATKLRGEVTTATIVGVEWPAAT